MRLSSSFLYSPLYLISRWDLFLYPVRDQFSVPNVWPVRTGFCMPGLPLFSIARSRLFRCPVGSIHLWFDYLMPGLRLFRMPVLFYPVTNILSVTALITYLSMVWNSFLFLLKIKRFLAILFCIL